MINSNKLNREDFELLIKLYNSGKFDKAEKKNFKPVQNISG